MSLIMEQVVSVLIVGPVAIVLGTLVIIFREPFWRAYNKTTRDLAGDRIANRLTKGGSPTTYLVVGILFILMGRIPLLVGLARFLQS